MSKENYDSVQVVSLKMVCNEEIQVYDFVVSAEDVASMMKPFYEGAYREQVYVIGLNTRNKPQIIHLVSVGSVESCPIPIASVLKPLLLANCLGAILVHNHPAGSLYPSDADIAITQKVKEALKLVDITLLDHVILNADVTYHTSMRSHSFSSSIWA